jgi:quinoprotein glucose dehydrogenase
MPRSPWLTALGPITILAALLARSMTAQERAQPGGDWQMYRKDQAGTGYSTLSQITPANVATLRQAWTFNLQGDASPPPTGRGGGPGGVNSQATPIVVNGVMYLPTANRVVALDAAAGSEIWQHTVTGGAPSRRGVAYWSGDGASTPRIIFTSGRRLIALNAKTGAVENTFGKDGEVDIGIPYNSVPFVFRNVVVVGANTPPGTPGGIGNARAYDARSGAKLWEFSSVPQPGSVGHDTWEGDSWKGRLGVNAWPFYFTLDVQRELLYIPLASPIPGAYGGDRKGANLFGNSVVAVDVLTGKYRWHFQTIHHDLWDADPPAPPTLFEIVRDGKTIPALAVTTKSGYMYILNRENGQPIFGVEERPVARSDVPGELAFPTQPIPIKPPAIARVAYTPDDLVTAADTTPEHAAACSELIAKIGGVQNSGPFTPWGFRGEGAPSRTTLVFPGGLGGANWGGTAYDRNLRLVFVATQDVGALGSMVKAKEGSMVPYEKATPGRSTFDVRMGDANWPCQKPPWGKLIAVNTATGDFAWQVPLGVTEQLPPGKQNTGRPVLAGPIVTASGLLFIGSTDDSRFRALDARSGKELWVTKLERRGNADPITYQGGNGRQYVAIVATDTLLVFALP